MRMTAARSDADEAWDDDEDKDEDRDNASQGLRPRTPNADRSSAARLDTAEAAAPHGRATRGGGGKPHRRRFPPPPRSPTSFPRPHSSPPGSKSRRRVSERLPRVDRLRHRKRRLSHLPEGELGAGERREGGSGGGRRTGGGGGSPPAPLGSTVRRSPFLTSKPSGA